MTQYFWEIQAPKCIPMAPGLLLFFGHNPRLGEHISRLGGARPRNAPRGAEPAFLPPPKRLFR